jgi:hypothetical protein
MKKLPDFSDGAFGIEFNGQSARWRGGLALKKDKKLTLSKETLRTLDEKELSLVVGGASGNHQPPNGGPNSCPNTKAAGCS